eukprot:TRINITY_DN1884_c0_g1_i1.p1 TRINITY_DN1884_c0_g1~~TRINITY_DN1884_c0_g1_i1.p1  ORF type:complete len:124 (-),score=14.84 TRINITY_DN1884_c0_g1_i1:80-451(-)
MKRRRRPRAGLCWSCHMPASKFCLGCRVAQYCRPEHQQKDWKARHGVECSEYQALSEAERDDINTRKRDKCAACLMCTSTKAPAVEDQESEAEEESDDEKIPWEAKDSSAESKDTSVPMSRMV